LVGVAKGSTSKDSNLEVFSSKQFSIGADLLVGAATVSVEVDVSTEAPHVGDGGWLDVLSVCLGLKDRISKSLSSSCAVSYFTNELDS
jgi:hypothetical protein